MSSPTQRTIALLHKKGYTPRVVEHWNAYAKVRQDLFGFIDVVALHPDKKGILGVQTTTYQNINVRVRKALAIPQCKLWLQCGNSIEFHGWRYWGHKWIPEIKELFIGPDGQILIL